MYDIVFDEKAIEFLEKIEKNAREEFSTPCRWILKLRTNQKD